MQNNPPSSIHYHSPLSQEPISREIKFLIACCQTTPTEEDTAFIFDYLSALNSSSQSDDPYPLSLSTVSTMASRHGVLPLVYKTLKNLQHVILNSLQDPDTGSEPGMTDSQRHSGLDPESSLNAKHLTLNALIAELKTRYQSIAQRNMLMTAELLRIMKLLKENNIEAIAFKGPALAQMAYGDITLRQYADLDILIDEKDAYTAGELFQKNCFTSLYPLSILNNKTCMHLDSDFAFTGNSNNILIEMHWRLFRKNIGHHLTFEEFSRDSQIIKINGTSIKTLSPELHLLYLSLHGSKHAWERIEWIVDIDKFINKNTLDNEKLKEIFKLMDADRPILTGLLLAHKLFHTPIPDWIQEQIEGDNEVKKLYTITIKLLNNDLYTMTETLKVRTIYLYQLRFFKTPLEKIKYFFESYLSISRNDCLEFPLPPYLKFLYIFIKPFRVLQKYF